MCARQIVKAIAAFLIGAALVAALLFAVLPFPPTPIPAGSRFGQLMLLVLIGPITFAWSWWGPHPVGVLGAVLAIAIPAASIAALVMGFFRRKSGKALIASGLIWSVFGGLSAAAAVYGTI